MRKYVACLKEHGNNGADRECRALAKGYLQCRMDQCVGAPRASTHHRRPSAFGALLEGDEYCVAA